MKRMLIAVLSVLALFVSLLFAQPKLATSPPPETAQFAFLVGTWDCDTWWMQPDGKYVQGKAVWEARWDYDGFALLDHYSRLGKDGEILSRGTGYRSFDPDSSRWNFFTFQLNGSFGLHAYWKKQDNGDMLTYWKRQDLKGSEVLDRVRFTAITDSSFEWRLDRSRDNGESWVENGFYIIAKRMK